MRTQIFPILLLFLISSGLYLQTLGFDFANYDDGWLVTLNPHIQGLTIKNIKTLFTPGSQIAYLPLRDISYAIDYTIWGLNPKGYHLTNIILYGLNVSFLYLFFKELSQRIWPSFLAAFIFAVHPIHAESVAWVSGRRELLSGIFFTLSLLFFIKFRKASGKNSVPYLISLISFLFSLLSKATTIILPLVLPILDYFYTGKKSKELLKEKAYIPFYLISAFFVILSFIVGVSKGAIKSYPEEGIFSLGITMAWVFYQYLSKLLLPINLSSYYNVDVLTTSFSINFLFAGLFWSFLLFLIIALKGIRREFSFFLLWFLITLLPVSNILYTDTYMADRYLYLPSIGFSLCLAALITPTLTLPLLLTQKGEGIEKKSPPPLRGRIKVGGIFMLKGALQGHKGLLLPSLILAFYLISLAQFTFHRAQVWRDGITLGRDMIIESPKDGTGYVVMGAAFFDAGLYNKAMEAYEKALKLEKKNPVAYVGLGFCYILQDRYWDAIVNFRKAADIDSTTFMRLEKSLEAFIKKLKKRSEKRDNWVMMGVLYELKGELPKAEECFIKALKGNKSNPSAWNNLGIIYGKMELFDKARECFEKALKISPDMKEAKKNLLFLEELKTKKKSRWNLFSGLTNLTLSD